MAHMTVADAIRLALEHQQANRLREAETIYRQILAHDPRHPDALHLLGIVRHQKGDDQSALELISLAVDVNPTVPAYQNNLGNILRRLGRVGDAEVAYRRAIALSPSFVDAYRNLSVLMEQAGRIGDAIEACQPLVRLQPNVPEHWNVLGNLLSARNRMDEAIAAYRQAIRLRPEFAEAWSNLGDVLAASDFHDEAIEACERAIALRPGFAEAFNNLGNALRLRGRTSEAVAAYRRAIALNPNFAQTYVNLGTALADQGELQEAVDACRTGLRIQPSRQMHSNYLMHLNALDTLTGEEVFREHLEWDRLYGSKRTAVVRSSRDPDRRLRVGYVSPDFKRHSVAYFLEPLLAQHDHAQVEVFCYSDVIADDDVTERFKGYADRWIRSTEMSDAELIEHIGKDGIDILVDLAGHTSRNRLEVFAHKPAPVQVNYLGYPATTGLGAMDYRITDEWADPPGLTDRFYTETLIRLNRCFLCYRMSEELPAVGELPALRNGYVTFGSFNHFTKVSESALKLWAKVLQHVPRSKLLLKFRGADDPATQDSILQRLIDQGVDGDRVELLGVTDRYHDHLELYNRMDIALDPFPYNGTTTTCEAMAMGVPVVTRTGETHISRVGLSLLRAVGLDPWVGESDERYLQISAEKATPLEGLSSLRSALRQRMKDSPLCDEVGLARAIEAAYRQIWRTWCTSGA